MALVRAQLSCRLVVGRRAPGSVVGECSYSCELIRTMKTKSGWEIKGGRRSRLGVIRLPPTNSMSHGPLWLCKWVSIQGALVDLVRNFQSLL